MVSEYNQNENSVLKECKCIFKKNFFKIIIYILKITDCIQIKFKTMKFLKIYIKIFFYVQPKNSNVAHFPSVRKGIVIIDF